MTFGFFAVLVWLGYVAMMTGLPPKHRQQLRQDWRRASCAQFDLLPFARRRSRSRSAWLYLAFFTAPSPTRGVARWAAGVALLWGTFATLWLPWADHIKSYRSVALQLQGRRCRRAPAASPQASSPRRSAPRSATTPASAPSRCRRAGQPAAVPLPASCRAIRAARSRPGPAGASSPTSAGPATGASATACIVTAEPDEHHLADRLPGLEKARRATPRAGARRSSPSCFAGDPARAHADAGRGARRALDYSRQRAGRAHAAPARPARRRARLRRMARRAVRRREDQHHRGPRA